MATTITHIVGTSALKEHLKEKFGDRKILPATFCELPDKVLSTPLTPEQAASLAADFFPLTADLPWEFVNIRRMREVEMVRFGYVALDDKFAPAIYRIQQGG